MGLVRNVRETACEIQTYNCVFFHSVSLILNSSDDSYFGACLYLSVFVQCCLGRVTNNLIKVTCYNCLYVT